MQNHESDALVGYIRESRALNISDHDIARNLLAASWPAQSVRDAFALFEKKNPIVTVRGLYKEYVETGDNITAALNGIPELDILEGEFLSISGQSGSGKTTLLNILGLIDTPTRGEVHIQGTDVLQMSEHEKTRFRLTSIAYVFQFFNLLENYTALENIMFQLKLNGTGHFAAKKKGLEVLEFLGLQERAHNYPSELSGGQQQRLAIGRAIAKDAPLLLADEPTAHLDTQNADKIMMLLREVNTKYNKTIVLVTHEPSYAKRADRIVYMSDGRVTKTEDGTVKQKINWGLLEEEIKTAPAPSTPAPAAAA